MKKERIKESIKVHKKIARKRFLFYENAFKGK